MLGDEEEKKPGNPLNPLKKAMRRRNAKTVQFAAPSYVEPSDVEYSTDEEDGNGEYIGLEQDRVTAQSNDQGRPNDDGAAVEPLQARGPAGLNGERVTDQGIRDVGVDQGSALDLGRTSEDALERPGELANQSQS